MLAFCWISAALLLLLMLANFTLFVGFALVKRYQLAILFVYLQLILLLLCLSAMAGGVAFFLLESRATGEKRGQRTTGLLARLPAEHSAHSGAECAIRARQPGAAPAA